MTATPGRCLGRCGGRHPRGPVHLRWPGSGPRRWFASGGPTFGRPKVGGKTAGETPAPLCLSNRTLPNFVGAQPPNQRFLRVSDLRRVSRRCFGCRPFEGGDEAIFSASDCLQLPELHQLLPEHDGTNPRHQGQAERVNRPAGKPPYLARRRARRKPLWNRYCSSAELTALYRGS